MFSSSPMRWRQDAPRLVQPQRLAAEPASRRDFPDEEVGALHDRQHRACPLGQGQAQFDAELFKSSDHAGLGAGRGSRGSGSCMVAGTHCVACKLMEGPMEPVDVNSIREAVRKRYAEVSSSRAGRFEYLTGRGGALDLGYEPRMLDAIPDDILVAFCGVGNPFALGRVATEGAELSRNPPSTPPGCPIAVRRHRSQGRSCPGSRRESRRVVRLNGWRDPGTG